MIARGLEPDVYSYSAAISACEKVGDWPRALALLDAMQARGLEPNVVSFNAAILACAHAARWERALALLYDMQKRELQPDVTTFNAVLAAFQRAGQLDARAARAAQPDGARAAADRRDVLQCRIADVLARWERAVTAGAEPPLQRLH